MFSCEFCEVSHNTFFKEPFGRLFLHKHLFCLLRHHDLLFFQKWFHTYFPAEYFLGLIYRLGTRVSSIFQTLTQAPTNEMWTKKKLFILQLERFLIIIFLHQVDICRFCIIWKQTELTFCFTTILKVLFLYFPSCFLFVL